MIRPARESDLAFIIDAWVGSYRCSPDAPRLPARTFRREFRQVVRDLLSRPTTATLVMCSDVVGFDNLLSAFISVQVTDGCCTALLYAFTKSARRYEGIASALLEAAGIRPGQLFDFAQRTRDWKGVLRTSKRWSKGRYRPRLIGAEDRNEHHRKAGETADDPLGSRRVHP